MMPLPLTPCHLLAIAHTLAIPIISLNNKVDYSVFCKNYSLLIQNQHDNQPLSVAITPIAFPWCFLGNGKGPFVGEASNCTIIWNKNIEEESCYCSCNPISRCRYNPVITS